ncbi:MAG: hypothetical protein K2W91_13915 [Novosphingobium sp.]|nr:hypothetical protein [Novosphingobium sp.]
MVHFSLRSLIDPAPTTVLNTRHRPLLETRLPGWIVIAVPAAAESEGVIGGALRDVTAPEPLPADHSLWGLESARVTMHL